MSHITSKTAWIIILIFGTIVSCTTDIYDTYNDYLSETGSAVAVGKPGMIVTRPGNEKILFLIPVNADPKIAKGVISWNNGEDMQPFDITTRDTLDVLVDIPEGNYNFVLWFEDDSGQKSLTTEHTASVYGPNYQSGLQNRSIEQMTSVGKNLKIEWATPEESVLNSRLIYQTAEDSVLTILIHADENESIVPDFPAGESFALETWHSPDSAAIDSFLSPRAEFNFPDIYKLDPSLIMPVHLPNDIVADAHGGSLNKLFNGNTGNGDWYHTYSEERTPYHFTFDLGVSAQLTRFKLYPRQDCCYERTPRKFQLWGISDTTNAATSLSADNPGWAQESQDKGWTLLVEDVQSEQPTDGTPIQVDIDKMENVRFVRFVFLEAWVEDSDTHLTEFEFWADQIN
ncbi:discoidin domain-containing protein [Membranicola marinus]|uniref:Discoidin domain-containing protein n=1 Tax=Membranihabitans marinus TaxID=1227546 RepID=A0A953HQW6_9BACT|nr:DUF4998 domain-containing protein [Membranihabitans marinus]MBY5956735.1 discoidin domain-containing protein [Membranihabitans marinus]